MLQLSNDSGDKSWRTSYVDETKNDIYRRPMQHRTTHLPLQQTPPPERRAGSPRWCCSSSWRSGSVEISLALKKTRRDVSHAACFHVFFELSWSSSFSPINQSSVWVYSRVSSNSVSEALLTVLKVLLALQREEKEELSAWVREKVHLQSELNMQLKR